MKQERSELEKILWARLEYLNKNGTIKSLINSDLLNDYMNKMALTRILNTKIPLDTLNVFELYHITRLINSYEYKVDTEKYFTSEEMTIAMVNKNNLKLKDNNLLIINNVLHHKNKDRDKEYWLAIVSYKQIYEWFKLGLLIYDVTTQRSGISKRVGGKIIYMPYINMKSVNEIKESMLKGIFDANQIAFNVFPDAKHDILWKEEDRQLIIDCSIFEVAVLDGFHRCTGIISAIEENENLDGEINIKITNKTKEKAQALIRQESKINPMNQEYFEKFNPDNKITKFINELNAMGSEKTNPLYNRIDIGVNTPNCWILFDNFKQGLYISGFLKEINESQSTTEVGRMQSFINRFFDKFYGIAKDNDVRIDNCEELTDPSFIMGLLVTCHKYYKTNTIDIDSIDMFIKKFKKNPKKYIFDTEQKKEEDKLIIKFKKLLEVSKDEI